MDLIGYLRLLRRRWWIISLAVLVCVGAAVGVTAMQHKRYQTSTRLLVSGSSSVSPLDEVTRRQLAQQRAVLFSQIATTSPVITAAEHAADAAGAKPPVATANPSIGASASGKDPFLTVTVTADTPEAAQAIANQFVNVLPPELAKLNQLPSVVKALLTVVSKAGLPSTPSSPDPERNLLIGLALGLVLGIAAALIRETLDTTLRDSEEVRRLVPATILGIVPREFDDERMPAATRPHSRRSEAYRQIRTNLEFADADEPPPRSIVVTSAGQGEGKSSTVANLALLISRAGKTVAIVDADLRKPTLASMFNATSDFGLSDVLSGRRSLQSVMQPVAGEQIMVIGSGPTVTRPSELLSSPAMEQVLHELVAGFDLVIVDSPPVLAITDALLVGKQTDGMVVVARMRRTTRSGLRRTVEAIERVHARLYGIVINAATETDDKRYGYTKGYAKGYLSDEMSPSEYLRSGPALRVPVAPQYAQMPPAHVPAPQMPPAPMPVPVQMPLPPPMQQMPPPQQMPAAQMPPPVYGREPAVEPVQAPVYRPEQAPAVPPPAYRRDPAFVQQPPPAYGPASIAADDTVAMPVFEEDLLPPPPPRYVPPRQPAAAEPEPQRYLPRQPPPVPPQVHVAREQAQPYPPVPPPYQPPVDDPPPPPRYQPPAYEVQEPEPQPAPEPAPPPPFLPPSPAVSEPEPPPPPPFLPPATEQPPAYQPPPPPPFPAREPQHAAPPSASEFGQHAADGLEQPEPTYRPPWSIGAMHADRESRTWSGGRRRRARVGRSDAEDDERESGDAGQPVDVDHAVEELSGNDRYGPGY